MVSVEQMARAVQDVLNEQGYIDIPNGLTHEEWKAKKISRHAQDLAEDLIKALNEQENNEAQAAVARG